MTELNSHSNNDNLNTSQNRTPTPAANNSLENSGKLSTLQYPRLDSKIILQNMEEVLDSMKKQHKEKHRRKKELKKLAMIESANCSKVSLPIDGASKDKKKELLEKKHKHRERDKRHTKKKLLHEKSLPENCKVSDVSPVKSCTILHHFARTPKKEDQGDDIEVFTGDKNSEKNKNVFDNANSSKVANAFEVMMNARNRSIGSNTPGKDSPSPVADKELSAENAKRKLKLQEWAEKMGGAKRQLEEEARAAYVEEQLEQRAKRFKHMLVSGASSKKNSSHNVRKTDGRSVADNNKLVENPKKIKTKKRKGQRARRLSSVDSLDLMEPTMHLNVDDETAEFLAKLNSPTKKRDSLLGYFHKKESPKETSKKLSGDAKKYKEEAKYDAPKRSVKSIPRNNGTPGIENHQLEQNKQEETSTPSSRQRRSCANKSRYDYDLESSPIKDAELEKNIQNRKIRKSLRIPKEPKCVDTIVLDDSTTLSGEITTPKKLAPLFVRSLPKPSPDPEIIKARRAFLESGVPEKLRLEQEKQKQFEQNFEETAEIFPQISHVKQLSKHELELEKFKCSLKLNSEENVLLSPSPSKKSKARSNKRQLFVARLSDCMIRDIQVRKNNCPDFSSEPIPLPSLANKRAVIKNWKTEFERFPTFKCYNQMREKYRYFSAIDSTQDTEQVSESFVVTRQVRRSLEGQKKLESPNTDEEYKPPPTAPNGEVLFCEKYKPLLYEQVLVNLNPVSQLREFLSSWSNNSHGSARNSQNVDDSVDLNDSTSSNQTPSSNTVVLLGPVSSGKTNAVFTLANEMNFNVLEINAGMKRTGKRLIQELQEATQSHQIRKDTAGPGSSQKSLLKMSLNGLKSKLKRRNSNSGQIESQSCDSNSSDLQNSSRKCLILIEDADIVFEQTDAGFTDAIYTLAASSKRPVIVVASDPNCTHLQRLMLQNTIHFSPPNVLNISKFLAVLSLMENCPVHLDDIISLYLYNRRDLRKTLLELQFFIQSGGDRQRQLQNKQDWKETDDGNSKYFASPRKRQFSVEQNEPEPSDNIPTAKNYTDAKASDQVYMHRSLFEYYTVCQNSQCRIPFPVNYYLLKANLNEIFKVSRNLEEDMNLKSNGSTTKVKRKSKSPKKQWLTEARESKKSPMDNLCSFYENLSVAALMDEPYLVFSYKNIPNPSIIDSLKPKISETVSHCLLEKSIEVNLAAELCPYNLFDAPKNSVSLCDELGTIHMRSYRARYLDYEPSLRSICRSEKIRSTLERRSTRFYHYLRNYSINVGNFSTLNFDQACEAFQTSETEDTLTTSPTAKPT